MSKTSDVKLKIDDYGYVIVASGTNDDMNTLKAVFADSRKAFFLDNMIEMSPPGGNSFFQFTFRLRDIRQSDLPKSAPLVFPDPHTMSRTGVHDEYEMVRKLSMRSRRLEIFLHLLAALVGVVLGTAIWRFAGL